MIDAGRAPKLPKRVPAAASREDLLDFVRSWSPDLRIRNVRLEDGRRACGAKFTFRGEPLLVEVIESADYPDPDDALVRQCAWLIWRRLGLPTALEDAKRREMERAIVAASLRGDTATVEKLGLDLSLANEGIRQPPQRGPRFEDFGGSMFERSPTRVTGW